MRQAKSEIVALPPFSFPNQNSRSNFALVSDNTQKSLFVQNEIEEFSTEIKTDKNLTNIGNAPITRRVHDQRTTNLCASFSTVSTLRGAATNYLTDKGNIQRRRLFRLSVLYRMAVPSSH